MKTNEQCKTQSEDIALSSESKLQKIITDLNMAVPPKAEVEVSSDQETEDVEVSIQEMNTFFEQKYRIYNEVLAPQLKENERLKRRHKEVLLTTLFKFLKYQFIATYIIIFILIIIVAANKYLNITEKIISEIFSFLRFYITTIVAELIAILFFIVKNVFDKSIVDLFRNFDKKDQDGNKHK